MSRRFGSRSTAPLVLAVAVLAALVRAGVASASAAGLSGSSPDALDGHGFAHLFAAAASGGGIPTATWVIIVVASLAGLAGIVYLFWRGRGDSHGGLRCARAISPRTR